jgi:hypothetical protein
VQQHLQYLLTEPSIVGAVAWIGLFATLIGLTIAIQQIRQVKTAAVAAAKAAQNLSNEVRARERLIELTTIQGHLESAGQHMVRKEFALAGVFVDLAINGCVQVKELLDGTSERGTYGLLVRLRKLSEALVRSINEGTESDNSVSLAIEARDVRVQLGEIAARMRYQYNNQEERHG